MTDLTDLNDRIVAALLQWQQSRGALNRSPQAHTLADELIAMVREHDRTLSAADANATIRMLQAFENYLSVVDALVRALDEAGVAVGGAGSGDGLDPADLRTELTVLIRALKDSTTARPVPTPAQVASVARRATDAVPASRARKKTTIPRAALNG